MTSYYVYNRGSITMRIDLSRYNSVVPTTRYSDTRYQYCCCPVTIYVAVLTSRDTTRWRSFEQAFVDPDECYAFCRDVGKALATYIEATSGAPAAQAVARDAEATDKLKPPKVSRVVPVAVAVAEGEGEEGEET